jgi:flagellar export protein FliJ
MKFRFPLETVLRFRKSLEKREWLALQAIAQRLQRTREETSRLEAERKTGRALVQDEMRKGLAGSALHFVCACDAVSARELQHKLNELVTFQQEYNKQQQVFLNARQQREVIEQLRHQEYQRFLRESARREQAEADEMYLIKRQVLRS